MAHQLNRRCLLVAVALLAFAQFLPSASASFLQVDTMGLRRTVKVSPSNKQTPWIVFRGGGGNTESSLSAGGVVFDNAPFWQAQSLIAGANALGFVVSLATGSHLHLDLLGTGAFALGASVPLLNSRGPLLQRLQWSSAAVVVWGAKLAGFLFFRALKIRHDVRLTDTLSTASGTTMFWVISWFWGVVCSLPHTLGTTSSSPGNPVCTKIGAAMYVIGLVTETLADYQKWTFKQSNPGMFCNVGLWSLSQHPNFFGNLLLWSGIFVMNAPALVDPSGKNFFQMYKRVGLALMSPLFLYAWFSGQASGTIANSVELFEKKYGDKPGFQDYVDKVPLLFPNPFRRQS